ncbi:hypothetical protein FI667_g11891, partial [Globisporangium splendens]
MRQPGEGFGGGFGFAGGIPDLPELESLDLNILRDWLDGSNFSSDDDRDESEEMGMDVDDDTSAVELSPLMALLQQHVPQLASVAETMMSGSSSSSKRTRNAARKLQATKKEPGVAAIPESPASTRSLSASDDEPRKKTWPNQREELAYLRVKVCEMENQLQELKNASRKQFKSQVLARISNGDSEGMVSCSTPAALWEQVANRQLDEKNRAEVENRKLRGMVESQIRLAKKLQQLLRKRQIWEGLMETKAKNEMHFKPEESKIYGFLAQQIVERYPFIDAFFDELGMTRVANEAREVNVKYDETNVTMNADGTPSNKGGIMYLEMKECKLMPFDFRMADSAVWRCLKAEIIKMQNTSATIIEDDDHVLRAKVAVNIAGRGSEVELTVWSYWRRFVEAERIVYTVESLGITGGDMSTGTPIVQLKQSATAVIRQLQQTTAPVASIIKVYMRSTPSIIQDLDLSAQETHTGVDSHPHVGVLTDMLIGSYQQNIESMYKAVENLLLDDMFKMSRAGRVA